MAIGRLCVAAALLCSVSTHVLAVEGSSTAGPIGGTDMRSAMLPGPGIYGGAVLFHAEANRFFDGSGRAIPALDALNLFRERVGGFLLYVPETQVLGGSLGFLGVLSSGQECGRLFQSTPKRCINGGGDPYVEFDWSRYFGTVRPSQYPGAFPIPEGLTIQLGFGAVVPIGKYDAMTAAQQGLVIGNNIWDLSPIAAFTYITRPIIAEGTEISAKSYWNNYLRNPDTLYSTGSLLNLDFAVTERIGRLQIGVAGFYATQVDDDKLLGTRIPPDGRRATVLDLGGVVAYDMPEYATSLKLKALTTVVTDNTVKSYGVSLALVKKLW